MFANLLLTPFALLTCTFLYLSWSVDPGYAPWMIPFLLITAVIFILAPQINWWWYSRHPKKLAPEMQSLLERYSVFYNSLTAKEREQFQSRVFLYTLGTDWTPIAFPEDVLPPDIQMMLAAQAVTLTFRKPQFLFHKFEKIIVYPMPFPSPEYQFNHASELYPADGCLLFSAREVVAGFLQPGRMYNVGLHEFARVFVLTYPDAPYPVFDGLDVWPRLKLVSELTRDQVEQMIGIAGVDVLPVAIHHYFTYPERFRVAFPDETPIFDQIFSA